jgi:predicted molibdopterin-dependent oxidoreductase YjgC
MSHVPTICCYCGCGCGLYLRVEEGRVVGSTPSRRHPVSRNNLCIKGWHVHEFIHDSARLTVPLVRQGGRLVPASWDEALTLTAKGLGDIKRSRGGRALGVLSSARCTNEENYLLQKLTRAVFHSNNVDNCARL